MAQKQNELPTAKARMDKQGGFVIPAAFRQALGLKDGDDVVMQWKDEDIVITRAPRKRKTLRRRTAR